MSNVVEQFRITPENTCLALLSPTEIDALFAESNRQVHRLLERCAVPFPVASRVPGARLNG